MTACRMTVPTTRARLASPVYCGSTRLITIGAEIPGPTLLISSYSMGGAAARLKSTSICAIASIGSPFRLAGENLHDRSAVTAFSSRPNPTVLTVRKTFIQPLTSNVASKVLRTVKTVGDRKSTRLNSSHDQISYAVFCLKKKKQIPDLC